MTLIGFSVFKEKILSGAKRQTIRPLRKKPIKVGEKLYLYWHLRRKTCEKIGEAICSEIFFIRWRKPGITEYLDLITLDANYQPLRVLSKLEMDEIARKDGFKDFPEMVCWFKKRYHFLPCMAFQVIRW